MPLKACLRPIKNPLLFLMNDLNKLPGHARVWIYQANRTLLESDQKAIREKLDPFIAAWQAHGANLSAGYEILHDRFVVLAVDEQRQPATGCSIDQSVHLILALEKELDLSLTDRKLIAYRESGEIRVEPMHQFWALRKAERVTGETSVFDNLVKTLDEFSTGWEKPFRESWHQTMWH